MKAVGLSFGIVVPSLNAEKTILDTLRSLATQASSRKFHVHVQDGASTDKTIQKVEDWLNGLEKDPNLLVTVSSEKDSGPAQAINRGMRAISADVLTWLGADDVLAPYALECVASYMETYPTRQWVTGVSSQMDTRGVPLGLRGPKSYHRIPFGFAQSRLAAGSHANFWAGTIQQEGTFWTANAWEECGGYVDEDLQLAFDFELWCRLARKYELVQLPVPLASFRKSEGQLSADKQSYISEVKVIRRRYRSLKGRPRGVRAFRRVLGWLDPKSGEWRERQYWIGPLLITRTLEGIANQLRHKLPTKNTGDPDTTSRDKHRVT